MKFWEKLKKYLFKNNSIQEFDISKDFNFAGEDGDDDPDDDPDGPPPCPPPDPNCPPCPPCDGAGSGPKRNIGKFAARPPGIAKDAQFKQEFEEFKGFEAKIVGIGPIPGGSNINVCPTPPNCAPGGSVTVSQNGPQDCQFTVTAGGSGGNNPGGSIQCTFTY